MVDWHRILIIFRTHWERIFIPLFIHFLSSHAFFIYYRVENFVREEIKTNLCTETQCVHCWLKSCSKQSLASQSSTCPVIQERRHRTIILRSEMVILKKPRFISSSNLPSLYGIRPPGMAYVVREGLGLLQHLESSRVTQELSASSGEQTQCQVDQKKKGTSIKCTSLDSIKVRKALALLPTKCENFMMISFCKASEQVRLTC